MRTPLVAIMIGFLFLSSFVPIYSPIVVGSTLNQIYADVGNTFATATYGDEAQAGRMVGGTDYIYFYWHNWVDGTGEALQSPNATLFSPDGPSAFFSISPHPNSTTIVGSNYSYSWTQDYLAEDNFMSTHLQENATDMGALNFRARRDVSPSNVSSMEAIVNLTVTVTPIQDVERLCVEVVLESSSQFNTSLIQAQVDPQPNPVRPPLNFTSESSANWEITNALTNVTYVFKLPIQLYNFAYPEPVTYKPKVHVYTHFGMGQNVFQIGSSVSSLHPKWGNLTFSGDGTYTWITNEKISTICDLMMRSSWWATPTDSNMVSVHDLGGSRARDPHVNGGGDLELLSDVYETLLYYDREKTNSFVPRLATSWNVSEDVLEYTFTMRQGVKFHNGEILTTEDIEYSMERILVIEGEWPGCLLYDALLGIPGSRDEDGNIVVNSTQLDEAITRTDATVTFHLTRPYPPFLQVLCLPVMAIMNKDWCTAIGEWPGTWNNWTYYNRRSSMIVLQNTDPPGPHVNAMCGTGPYMLDYFTPGVEYSIVKFDDYWGGWPAPGLHNSIVRGTVKKIDDWATRRDLFLTGQVDCVTVPRTALDEVLGQAGVQCFYPLPILEVETMLFNFNISTSSPFLGVPGGLPLGTFNESGIPPDLFSDINVRKGFAYAFNYSQLIEEVSQGDAFQPATPIIPGLPYYNPDQEKYTQNLTKAREYLETAWNGELWANGFNMTICYVSSMTWSQQTCENIKVNIESINSKFHIEIHAVDDIWDYLTAQELPVPLVDWAADFPDEHNFASVFMNYAFPGYAHNQNYRNATIEALVNQGIATTNTTQRKEIYYQLQHLYWEDCPGVPLYQPRARVFMRDWVQGWCYNPIIGWFDGGFHYLYTEWKETVPPHVLSPGENVVDSVSSTGTIVSVNTTVPGNLTITSHDIGLEGVTEQGTNVSAVKCVTVDTTVPHENITFPIEIRIYYTDEEVVSAYVDQSTLRMFYWNGTNWVLENETGVVTPSDIQGYSGYVWARIWHLSEFAVMGQQTLIHAIAPKDVRSSKTVIGQGYTASLCVDAFNQGDYEENFNVTVCVNTTPVGTIINVSLLPRNSATLTLTWNTSGFAKGDYALTGVADPVPGETATMDNNYTGTIQVHVGVPGDVSSSAPGVYDKKVDMKDIAYLVILFNTKPSPPNWNPNADVDNNGVVSMIDIAIAILNFNQHE